MKNMNQKQSMKFTGIMFLLSAGMFMVAGALADQAAFYGVGASFIGVSVVFLALSKTTDHEKSSGK